MTRKIIHIDCDCFYAAVEERDNPDLKGLPVAVGGRSDRRGVVATCNYKAREFGIHSAMASSRAFKLCPDLIMLPPRMDVYRDVSQAIHVVFKKYTSLIEPLSLDEAYLDVTHCELEQGSATWIAQAIRNDIEKATGITASAGVAPNKFLAKVASDWNKPNGQFVILPHEIDSFVERLAVKKIPGVGAVTNKKMQRRGIKTCGDLSKLSKQDLAKNFGSFGERLFNLSRGIDHRELVTQRNRKSISVESTFNEDLETLQACIDGVPDLLERLDKRASAHLSQCKSIFVKIKFSDFSITTAEVGVVYSIDSMSDEKIKAEFITLLETAFSRKKKPVRLIGVGMRLKNDKQEISSTAYLRQMSLFE